MWVLPISSSVRSVGCSVSALLDGVCLLNWNICLCWFWKLKKKILCYSPMNQQGSTYGYNISSCIKSSLLLTLLPPKKFFSHLPGCSGGYISAKDHSIMSFSRSCARLQWSVRISQTPFRCSDWKISVWHINPKWHSLAFHMNPFYSFQKLFLGRPSIVPSGSRSFGRRG